MKKDKIRYIVFAFYPHSGIKVRQTEYSNLSEMYEYIGQGLRMCYTPYIAFDLEKDKVLDKETYLLSGDKMAEMLEEYWNE